MSYHEADGKVILTMTDDDYERLLLIFGMAAGAALAGRGLLNLDSILRTLNHVNEGNPAYRPYIVEKAS